MKVVILVFMLKLCSFGGNDWRKLGQLVGLVWQPMVTCLKVI